MNDKVGQCLCVLRFCLFDVLEVNGWRKIDNDWFYGWSVSERDCGVFHNGNINNSFVGLLIEGSFYIYRWNGGAIVILLGIDMKTIYCSVGVEVWNLILCVILLEIYRMGKMIKYLFKKNVAIWTFVHEI